MVRKIAIVIAVISILALTASLVAARSPNILDQHTRVSTSADSFTISGKAAGLAGGHTYTVALSGTITGQVQCQNPGGNNPPPKGFSLNASASVDVTAQKNGNLNFSVTQPTGASATADCPNPNWTYLVSYSGTVTVELWDGATLLDSQSVFVSFSNF